MVCLSSENQKEDPDEESNHVVERTTFTVDQGIKDEDEDPWIPVKGKRKVHFSEQ